VQKVLNKKEFDPEIGKVFDGTRSSGTIERVDRSQIKSESQKQESPQSPKETEKKDWGVMYQQAWETRTKLKKLVVDILPLNPKESAREREREQIGGKFVRTAN
jgi:hypothetical protein